MWLPDEARSLFVPAGRPAPSFHDPNDVLIGDLIRPLDEIPSVDVGLVGVPFDTSVLGRRGTRFGPAGIRASLYPSAACAPGIGVDLAKALALADFGDVSVVQTSVEETHRRVEAALAALYRLGVTPCVLGGDHGTSYATIKALAEATEGPIGVVQVDAHLDVREPPRGEITSGTPFRRLLDLPGRPLRPFNLAQVGVGDWRNSRYYLDYCRSLGTHVLTAREVHRRGVEAIADEALLAATAGVAGFFVSFDLDVLDPAYAPGVSAPAPGGLTSSEALDLVFLLGQHPLCRGFDLVELAPPLDLQDLSSRLAASLVLSFIAAMAARLGRGRPC